MFSFFVFIHQLFVVQEKAASLHFCFQCLGPLTNVHVGCESPGLTALLITTLRMQQHDCVPVETRQCAHILAVLFPPLLLVCPALEYILRSFY